MISFRCASCGEFLLCESERAESTRQTPSCGHEQVSPNKSETLVFCKPTVSNALVQTSSMLAIVLAALAFAIGLANRTGSTKSPASNVTQSTHTSNKVKINVLERDALHSVTGTAGIVRKGPSDIGDQIVINIHNWNCAYDRDR